MNDNNNQNIQQPDNSTPEVNGGQNERMFTQAEVNKIVSDRLARERAKAAEPPVVDEREKALREREQALEARETRYKCEDYLEEINLHEKYRDDFLKALDTSDFDKFKAIVDILGKPFIVTTVTRGSDPANPVILHTPSVDAGIAEAFKPKKSY